MGDQKRADHSSRAGNATPSAASSSTSAAFASYQAGRSQQPPSKKCAPRSTCLPWNGLTRRLRGAARYWWGWTMSYTSTKAWELVARMKSPLVAGASKR